MANAQESEARLPQALGVDLLRRAKLDLLRRWVCKESANQLLTLAA